MLIRGKNEVFDYFFLLFLLLLKLVSVSSFLLVLVNFLLLLIVEGGGLYKVRFCIMLFGVVKVEGGLGGGFIVFK